MEADDEMLEVDADITDADIQDVEADADADADIGGCYCQTVQWKTLPNLLVANRLGLLSFIIIFLIVIDIIVTIVIISAHLQEEL